MAPASAKAATQIWSTVETSGRVAALHRGQQPLLVLGIGDRRDLDLDAGVLRLEALHRLLLVLADSPDSVCWLSQNLSVTCCACTAAARSEQTDGHDRRDPR